MISFQTVYSICLIISETIEHVPVSIVPVCTDNQHWVTDRQKCRQGGRQDGWLADWPTDGQTDRPTDKLTESVVAV